MKFKEEGERNIFFDNADLVLFGIISVRKICLHSVNIYYRHIYTYYIFYSVTVSYSEWIKPKIQINSFVWSQT